MHAPQMVQNKSLLVQIHFELQRQPLREHNICFGRQFSSWAFAYTLSAPKYDRPCWNPDQNPNTMALPWPSRPVDSGHGKTRYCGNPLWRHKFTFNRQKILARSILTSCMLIKARWHFWRSTLNLVDFFAIRNPKPSSDRRDCCRRNEADHEVEVVGLDGKVGGVKKSGENQCSATWSPTRGEQRIFPPASAVAA